MKANVRAHAKAALKRGQIKRKHCNHCGARKAEMHHPDYSKPLDVVWLCRSCHLELHHGHEQPAQRCAA